MEFDVEAPVRRLTLAVATSVSPTLSEPVSASWLVSLLSGAPVSSPDSGAGEAGAQARSERVEPRAARAASEIQRTAVRCMVGLPGGRGAFLLSQASGLHGLAAMAALFRRPY